MYIQVSMAVTGEILVSPLHQITKNHPDRCTYNPQQQSTLRTAHIYICTSLCTVIVHNTAQNRSNNLPSYPTDSHYCSDVVYWRSWKEVGVTVEDSYMHFASCGGPDALKDGETSAEVVGCWTEKIASPCFVIIGHLVSWWAVVLSVDMDDVKWIYEKFWSVPRRCGGPIGQLDSVGSHGQCLLKRHLAAEYEA